jgi:hypothetical protein
MHGAGLSSRVSRRELQMFKRGVANDVTTAGRDLRAEDPEMRSRHYYGWPDSKVRALEEAAASICSSPDGWQPTQFFIDSVTPPYSVWPKAAVHLCAVHAVEAMLGFTTDADDPVCKINDSGAAGVRRAEKEKLGEAFMGLLRFLASFSETDSASPSSPSQSAARQDTFDVERDKFYETVERIVRSPQGRDSEQKTTKIRNICKYFEETWFADRWLGMFVSRRLACFRRPLTLNCRSRDVAGRVSADDLLGRGCSSRVRRCLLDP